MSVSSEEVFVIKGKNMSAMPAAPVPVSSSLRTYGETLHHLFIRHPRVLPGAQIQPGTLDPPRFVHVLTPFLLGVHKIDHVFVDQHGGLTLVVVMLEPDPGAVRFMTGQIMETLAAWFKTINLRDLRAHMESYWGSTNQKVTLIINELWPEGRTEEAFWENIQLRLDARHLRFILAAPQIPSGLVQVFEFLNSQFLSVQTLGLELRLYGDEASSMLLVPRIVGGARRPDHRTDDPEPFIWTPARMEGAIANVADPLLARRLHQLLEFFVTRQFYMPGASLEHPFFGVRGLSGERLFTFDLSGAIHLFYHEINQLDSILKRDDLLLSLRNLALLDPGLELKKKPISTQLRRNLFQLSEVEFSEFLATLSRYTGG